MQAKIIPMADSFKILWGTACDNKAGLPSSYLHYTK